MNRLMITLVRPRYRKLADFLRLRISVDGSAVSNKLGIANVLVADVPNRASSITVEIERPRTSREFQLEPDQSEICLLLLTDWKKPFLSRQVRIELINPDIIDTYAPPLDNGVELFHQPLKLVRMMVAGTLMFILSLFIMAYGLKMAVRFHYDPFIFAVSCGFALMGAYVMTLGLVAIRGVRDWRNRPLPLR